MRGIVMGKSLVVFVLASLFNAYALNVEIYDIATKKSVTLEEVKSAVEKDALILLGEYHYNSTIQKGQAFIVEQLVQGTESRGNFKVFWEFLDYPDQPQVDQAFLKYKKGELEGADFMAELMGSPRAGERNQTYLPIFQVAKEFDGKLMASNAPRAWKRIITSQGLNALDIDKLPAGMQMGSELYYDRFKSAMGGGGHLPGEDVIYRYFEAQCYTDNVMAWNMTRSKEELLSFLVVGNFHSDYYLGTTASLKLRTNRQIMSIKIVAKNELAEGELENLIATDSKYGDIADYLFVIAE
jgi:uncharacterized iron-regulated protein